MWTNQLRVFWQGNLQLILILKRERIESDSAKVYLPKEWLEFDD